VMLSPTGAKVVDFGISAVVGEADGATSGRGGRGGLATMGAVGTLGTLGTLGGPRGQIVGTPAYMAPERLTGGRADSATDVYSLGLMLYRALAGELPWPATSASQVLAAHAAGTPTLRVPDGVPDEIVAACQACVAKDPANRPSMAELALVLTGSIDEDVPVPIDVPRDLTPTRTMELTLAPTEPHVPVRVRRRHVVLAGVAAAALLLGLVGAMSQVSNGAPPDPGASFGDAAVPGASVSPPVVPARAGEEPRDGDNRGPGNGGNSGHGNGGGNGGSGRRG
jgi:eukaryotic-like serine/threonine-protein kinase